MKLNPLVLAFALIPLVGCGSDDASSKVNSTSSTYAVKAVDGYLRNAQVWLDINGNYQLDDNEPSALSGDGGNAILDVSGVSGSPEDYSIVVKAIAGKTIDEDTITTTNKNGSAITSPYLMSAPAGQTVISPLSTLVNITMKSSPISLSLDAAVEVVATGLGIDEDSLLDDYIEDDLGEIAAKASSIVELNILPESENELNDLAEGKTDIDDSLISAVSILKDNQLLTKDDEGELVTVQIIAEVEEIQEDAEGYAEYLITINAEGYDKDGDGIINRLDTFPDDNDEWSDIDNDGDGDNSDEDIDGDNVLNDADAFPFDATETADFDGDTIGDNADTDDDNDGVPDSDDAFPFDANETIDTDGDSVGNNADTDDDNDGTLDSDDAFPLDATEIADFDGDSVGNNADTDDDNDGTLDSDDAFPNDATETIDTDGDGVGDNSDAFPSDATETSDTDGDGIGDNSDTSPNIPNDSSDKATFDNATFDSATWQ